MYYFLALTFVAIVLVAVWLVRHPLVLLTINVVPAAWLTFGAAGAAIAAAALSGVVLAIRRPTPVG